jgi:hypothetical protein
MEQQPTSATEKELKDKSLPELMIDLYGDISDLVSTEIALAKAEIGEKVSVAGQGAGLISGSIFALIMAVGSGTALAIIGLANLVEAWLAALIITVLWLLMAGALALIGKWRFKRL